MSNSIIDYVFRALGLEYLGRTDIVQVPPKEKDLETLKTCDCSAGSCDCNNFETDSKDLPKFENKVNKKIVHASAEQKATKSLESVQEVLSDMMGDAPACDDCGHITVRNGSCYKCLNCGNSLGCS